MVSLRLSLPLFLSVSFSLKLETRDAVQVCGEGKGNERMVVRDEEVRKAIYVLQLAVDFGSTFKGSD
jgi:hypothetical protein